MSTNRGAVSGRAHGLGAMPTKHRWANKLWFRAQGVPLRFLAGIWHVCFRGSAFVEQLLKLWGPDKYDFPRTVT